MVALFVILTFIVFLVIDYFVLKSQKKEHPAFLTQAVFDKSSLMVPSNLLLSKNHVWMMPLANLTYKLGIDEFVYKCFNNLKMVPIASEGQKVEIGDGLFELVSNDKRIVVKSPVKGTVQSVNQELSEKAIADPYELGWGMVIAPEGIVDKSFRQGKLAVNWLKEEFIRFKDFLSVEVMADEEVGLTYADGGNIIEGVVGQLDDKTVKKFEEEFLNL